MDVDNDGNLFSLDDVLSKQLTRRDLLKAAGALGSVVALGPLLAACGSSGTNASTSPSTAASPVKGGTLRLGVIGGSNRDVVDAQLAMTSPDNLRGVQLFDTLLKYDHSYKLQPALADEVTPDAKGLVWTVRLKPDVTFHNGKTFTADDVIWTFKKILDPKFSNVVSSQFVDVDPTRIKALDKQTVQFTLKRPNADFRNNLAFQGSTIKPVGYDPKHPVGTGPFVYGTFVPGDRSVFPANRNYWGVGPYVDELHTLDFADVTAMVNALVGGSIDAASDVPAAQLPPVKQAGFKTVTSETGMFNYIFWNTAEKPFSDTRVLQAMRLIMDRSQMVEQALSGYGRVGNDMWAIYDPAYPKDVPQRVQDIEQAKSLLKQAGYPDLSFTLYTSPVNLAAVSGCLVFAQQAKEAGVTIKTKQLDVSIYWGNKYLTWPNGPGWYSAHPYLVQARECQTWNEPHWNNHQWFSLINQAFATVDDAKRNAIIKEAYNIDYTVGAWDIWSWANEVDAASQKVQGLVADASGVPFNGGYANELWLS